jgi:DnaJ domain
MPKEYNPPFAPPRAPSRQGGGSADTPPMHQPPSGIRAFTLGAGCRRFRLKDHYAALGVSSSATLAEIKKAFRQQAALHHPDRSDAAGAAARFRAAQEAYDILSDEARRTAYEGNRKRNLLDNPLETASEIWAAYFNRLI